MKFKKGQVAWNKGIKMSDKQKEKISETLKHQFKKNGRNVWNKGTTGLMRDISGKNNPFYGKKHTLEAKTKIIEALTRRTVSEETRDKISKSEKGKIISQETIQKRIKSFKGKYIGEKNWNWKGENVGYTGLHIWVKQQLGSPCLCKHCNKDGLTGHKIHWANISGEYKRELSDWIRLCVKCHRKFDKVNKLNL